MPMITSRNCKYSCDYCVSGNIGTQFRKRSNENIIEEVLYLRDNFGITDIIFYDDCFFCNPKTSNKDVEDFCNLLLEHDVGVTWQIELRTDLLLSLTDDSLKLLEQTGCRQINLGIENMRNESLASLGKTSSIAGLKEKNRHIAKMYNIKITATFILGGLNEDENTVRQLIADSKELSLSQAHFNPLFLYPGTKIYEECGFHIRDWYGLIIKDTMPWGEIVYESKELPLEKLLGLLELAYTNFYGKSSKTNTNPYSNRYNVRR